MWSQSLHLKNINPKTCGHVNQGKFEKKKKILAGYLVAHKKNNCLKLKK